MWKARTTWTLGPLRTLKDGLQRHTEAKLAPVRVPGPSARIRVADGMPYIGSSAGSNVAAPTIKTTNDMPIVQPPSFDALGLVPFQINPHYLDPDPNSKHMGETREERILQFLEENDTPVIGLREGAMLRIENGKTILRGSSGARIFRKGLEPVEISPGTQVDTL